MLNFALSIEVGYLSPMREAAYLVMLALIAVTSATLNSLRSSSVASIAVWPRPPQGTWLEAALDYVVAAAKLGERIERDLDAAVEGAEIAGHRIFERRRTRREAGAAQRGREDCVAGAGAGVQRLGHGSEIGREPAGQRRRDAENVCDMPAAPLELLAASQGSCTALMVRLLGRRIKAGLASAQRDVGRWRPADRGHAC